MREPKQKPRNNILYARGVDEGNVLFVKQRCLELNCSLGTYINHILGEVKSRHESGNKVRGKGRQKNKKLA